MNSLLLYISRILLSVLSLLGLSIISRYVDASVWGDYIYYNITIIFGVTIVETLSTSSFYYFNSKKNNSRINLISFHITYVAILSLIISLPLVVLLKSSIMLELNYFVLFIVVFIQLFIQFFSPIAYVDKFYDGLIIYEFGSTVSIFIGYCLLSFRYLNLSLFLVYLVFFPTLFITFYFIKKGVRIKKFTFNSHFLRNYFAYAFPVTLSSFSGMLLRKIDVYFIKLFGNSSILANYSFGSYDVPVISIITNTLFSQYSDLLHRVQSDFNNIKKTIEVWKLLHLSSFMILFPFFIFLLFNSTELFLFLFSEKHSNADQIFKIFLFLIPLKSANFGLLLRVQNLTSKIFVSTLIGLAFLLVIIYPCYLLLGINGVALSIVTSVYLLAFTQLVFAFKGNFRHFVNVFDLREILYIFIYFTSIIFTLDYLVKYIILKAGLFLLSFLVYLILTSKRSIYWKIFSGKYNYE